MKVEKEEERKKGQTGRKEGRKEAKKKGRKGFIGSRQIMKVE